MAEAIRDYEGREYTIYFTGFELRGINSGTRHVKVLSSGTKWVRLKIGTKERRMPLDDWLKLLKGALEQQKKQENSRPIKRR